jgi:prepilin-type N-terminal cleavage/methylation domain-containing protein
MASRVAGYQRGRGMNRRSPRVQRARAGFTLVELMITVAIVSILAATSLPMLSTYIRRSRTTEATAFLSEIKSRQESYRFDFGMYCNVSNGPANTYPTGTPTAAARVWAPNTQWNMLGASPPGRRSLFAYSTTAAPPNTLPVAMGFSDNRGYDGSDFWFISTAAGNLDGDSATMLYESYSHSKGIWSSHGENGTE